MIKRCLSIGLGLLTATLLIGFQPVAAVAQDASAAAQQEGAAGMVSLDFKDIELADLVQTISELTGKNFLYDETVKGKATIISPDPISLDEAYELFLAVLNVKGFTVVPSGKTNKIIPLRTAKETNLPTVTRPDGATEQVVTRLVQLQYIDATEVANTVLAPLIPRTSNIAAYPASNTLIITDSAANIERLVEILRELDVPTDLDTLEVFHLEFADAEEVAKLATQILLDAAGAPGRRGRAAVNVQAAGGRTASKVLAYSRTNALVVLASSQDLDTIKALVKQLDRSAATGRSHINVYYLEHADAETLAGTLNEILTGVRAQTGARPGQAGQAQATVENVTITADKPTNSLIVNATPEDYEIIKEIISNLDIKRKQVFVEALILELSMDATKNLGASLQGAVDVGDDSVVFGTSNLNTGPTTLANITNPQGGLLTQSIQGILLGGLFNPITTVIDGEEVTIPALSALIDVSKTTGDVDILSAPRLLTSDNEEAEIIVGQNVPMITNRLTGAVGSTDSLAQSVSIERQDVALTLRFTPQITEGNLVRLNVLQEITDLAATSVGDPNQVGPTLTKRSVRNTVIAENGRTIVLGGLIGNNVQKTISKTPLLGDIPVLGWLFKRTRTQHRKTNLLIFITPRIITSGAELAEVTRRSRNDMDIFRDLGITPGWSIDPPPTRPAADVQRQETGN